MIGFIGNGNMGLPLIKGAIKTFGAENVICTSKNTGKNYNLCKDLGIQAIAANDMIAEQSDIIVLAIKPQMYAEVLEEIRPVIVASNKVKTVVSLAPGITIKDLVDEFEGKAMVVRAMPNTPASIGEGMTAVAFEDKFKAKTVIMKLFEGVGRVVELPERLIDASIVSSGSSPAFVYMFIEAMADGAVKCGMPRKQAYEMVAQSVLGSAKMVLESGKHPGELKDAVCSPGGTTIAGVAALEQNGFRGAVLSGCDALFEKATSMKK